MVPQMKLPFPAFVLAAVVLGSRPVVAQQPQQPPPQQFQPSGEWAKLPRMQLERQFAGPLQDTVVQRLRDPVDGTICYVYLPISAPHSPTTATGFVQYGPNGIGSINCMPGTPAVAAPTRHK
ncbi:hypothetical protein LUI11_36685 [Bradyrhizobium diazoefficiens]|uniref:Uncharacterized protein n=2 Tax=Bradyrhizobium diazoefficiens TaxID=1355477 RepID=A0A809YM56_9BRAD|nr:hypothetical protein [Bradyrhizobium diazoefficiens]AND90711.1 hypothetical protein AAV28_25170 [Bradyrhizobium diazoefficiens USDA 110]MDA9536671.1 hypothetical protein [Bradyrhizobium sp. CCBAU 21362]APO52318.1 hypothetical protein BD122_18640 [Bradyrhizobium diazoefficiens]KGJ71117.1 hypothetical protein BJA5080_06239 [Bradyrhizobium diazoefficiens SEMIA 5080]KOY05083.1 hypothetical protein AF336_38520 [Bradyrhizobium diazoefficiens]